LLAKNGGSINISKEWAKRLMRRIKRQGTTKAKVNPTDFQMLKKQYLADIRTKVYMEDTPADLNHWEISLAGVFPAYITCGSRNFPLGVHVNKAVSCLSS